MRGAYVLVAGTSDYKAVGAAAVQFDKVMTEREFWLFTTTTNCLISQSADPTAAPADGSTVVAAGQSVLIKGTQGAKLSVIRDTANGIATLTQISFIR